MIEPDARVVYRAIHWGFYPANVLKKLPDGRINIEVLSLSDRPMMRLASVRLADDRDSCGPGEAYVGDLLLSR